MGDKPHSHASTLVTGHAELGCVACHGGDGGAVAKAAAHVGLAPLGPAVEARCATCHEETAPVAPAPAKLAWAKWIAGRDSTTATPIATPLPVDVDLAPSLTAGRALFRSLRCGACHEARDVSPLSTPLEVLALRGSSAQLARAIVDHARTGVDLGLDESRATAVATHLRSIETPDAATQVVHRASVPGSSAEEGRTLYEKLACATCHETRIKLAPLLASRTPDWVAYFLADPAHANPASTMPSFRLSRREAASLAQLLAKPYALHEPPPDASNSAHKKEGEAIIATSKCGSCHGQATARSGPTLARYGETHNLAAIEIELTTHAGYRLDEPARRALTAYVLSQRVVDVRPDVRVHADAGAALFASLGCNACHGLDDLAVHAGPSLFGEGLRVRPQWLFDFLRAPDRHPVRPALHPEWAYRELVPADRVTARMPTYALTAEMTTSLVRFFTSRDDASFPYDAPPTVTLTGDALTSAIGDLTHKDRGACMTCHTLAQPDVARAREEGDKLAPPLALAHDRLRAAWIEACILQPQVWVTGMPPFARPLADGTRARDLVLLLRDRTVLPAPGAEGTVPALGLGDVF